MYITGAYGYIALCLVDYGVLIKRDIKYMVFEVHQRYLLAD